MLPLHRQELQHPSRPFQRPQQLLIGVALLQIGAFSYFLLTRPDSVLSERVIEHLSNMPRLEIASAGTMATIAFYGAMNMWANR